MKSWTIKSKLQFRFSTKWPLWLPAHKSSVGETHLCAKGQSCASDKFCLASVLRTGVIYICDFNFVSLRMPESLILVVKEKKSKSKPLRQSGDTTFTSPLPPGSVAGQSSPVVTDVTGAHRAGKRV